MSAMQPAYPSKLWEWNFEGIRVERQSVIYILTLLLLLLHADDYWYIRVPITILILGGFLWRALTPTFGYWFLLSLLSALGNVLNWQWADNHKYLIAYWCLALALSKLTYDPEGHLRTSARLMIGASFAFAVFWKVVSNDFLNGSFFETSLIFDDRFAYVARLLGGLIRPLAASNHAAEHSLLAFDSRLTVAPLQYTDGVRILARFFTWWAVITETLVALSFLHPNERRLFGIRRDYYLLMFLFSTYSIASVIGFGWVLATMGYAQAGDAPRFVGRLYLWAVVVMQAYKLPWRAIFGYMGLSG